LSKLLAPLALLAACFLAPAGAAADPNRLLPDLAFHFTCSELNRDAVEDRLGEFLRGKKFRVLNLGRLQRQHGVYLNDLRISGIDDQRRIFDADSFRTSPGRYAVSLVSAPPTTRAPELENALLTFVSEDLKCNVRQVSRNENPADAAAFHAREIARIENLFRQADEISGGRRL
jgi:hypothetical protein